MFTVEQVRDLNELELSVYEYEQFAAAKLSDLNISYYVSLRREGIGVDCTS